MLHSNTPLLRSTPLSQLAGANVWLKMDALQASGSFKLRGIGHACEHYARQGATRLITSSGGNAGLAVAFSGRQLEIPVLVVVPETTSERAITLLQQENAEVVVKGASWMEANSYAQTQISTIDAFIHPFDDPVVWEGHASLIKEVVEAGVQPDVVVLSVGGGGLLSGVHQGLNEAGLFDVPILAVETEGAASFRGSLINKKPITLDSVTTIATSLGAKKVCDQAYTLTQSRTVKSILVSDLQAVKACLGFVEDHRILVEPACGASLAVIYEGRSEPKFYENILVVVCGGATATLDQLQNWATSLRP